MTSTFSAVLHQILNLLLAPGYRPELHYMRGPGPKCGANPH